MIHVSASRTIMIVGNGPVPEGAAAIIDAADLVIRFNDCRSLGASGRKTDIVAVCNTGRPALAMLGGSRWKANAGVVQAAEIWCVRAREKFESLRPQLAETHPELDDFCDDYASGFLAFAKATGRGFRIIPDATHAFMDAELKRLDACSYVVPSSGAIVIADMLANRLQPDDRVMIAGFGHTGWDGHPFETERVWVDAHVAAGHLARVENLLSDASSITSAGSIKTAGSIKSGRLLKSPLLSELQR